MPNGISGYSGKQGRICNECHSGGAAPTVTLTGPTSLDPGASGNYTLTITGGAGQVGGLDVALDDAALAAGAELATVSAGTKKIGDEITQSAPASFQGGSLSFELKVTAPATPGSITLYGAGNSANGNDIATGDRAAAATLQITVGSATPPGEDGGVEPGTPDLATGPSTPAADLGTSTTPPSGNDSGGCSLAPGAAPSGSALVLLLVALALAFRRARA